MGVQISSGMVSEISEGYICEGRIAGIYLGTFHEDSTGVRCRNRSDGNS